MNSATTFWQKQKANLPTRWKLACVRCAIYTLIVGWSSFQVGVQGYDALSQMTQLQLIMLFGGMASTMLGVWLAFLDQTIAGWGQSGHQTPPAIPAPLSAPGNATR